MTGRCLPNLLALLAMLIMPALAFAKNIPSLTGPVVDEAGLLSPRAAAALAQAFGRLQQQGGPQIQFYLTDSLEGEALETFTIKVVEKWKLGEGKRDDGILFFVALHDRAMRLEVGQGLEGTITDAHSARMIRAITPYFKKGDYESGVVLMGQALLKELGGNLEGLPKPPAIRRSQTNQIEFYLTILIVIFILLTRRFRPGRAFYGGSGGFRSSSTSWSSGGGSSWSGGGGGFSGGGASGRW